MAQVRIRRTCAPLVAGLWFLLSGCASLYVEDAGTLPHVPRHELADWPYQEYWSGIVFNGVKIGFSHLRLAPAADAPGLFEVESQAVFTLRYLGLEKRFQLRSRDLVRPDLTLVRFVADANMDGNEITVAGEHDGGMLRVTTRSRDQTSQQELKVDPSLYPASVLYLNPVRRGLEVGNRFRYTVYDAELQQLAEVEQDVQAYERSGLFEGPAFRVETRMLGQSTTTWINERGLPVFELGLNGVLISALESEEAAKHYLVAASLNKQDTLLDFSLVRPVRPVAEPYTRNALKVALSGMGNVELPPPDARQHCVAGPGEILCELRRIAANGGAAAVPAEAKKYLEPTLAAPSAHPRIVQTAQTIAGDAPTPLATAERIVDWIQHNVAKEPVDVFSALDVLEGRKAECQGHTYLYTALARARGIPTRVVNGLTYSPEHQGFLYHTWAESWLGAGWISVDPTFAQIGVDATHIKLVEGEAPADLLPLVELLGRLKLRVIE
jgi:hypothetical protein